ncbi:MAG: tRNA (guanosine(46)-N7)-methyltransferase TrmB [Flavobacteriales bacterium]|nr:tRNA (guanosine(46)-N7)-methyltransferase TrmB [Flavobacteriales bacterium]
MGKNKLKKFAQMQNFSHVEQPNLEVLEKGYALKGNWRNDFFKNNNPLVLELGCGMGEYSVGLAEKFPEKNFLGIDIKGARIWQGAVEALKKKINNVGFLRIRIDWIEKCFDKNEIDEIWITFPDPQLKKKRGVKRLTHPVFLKRYEQILKKKGSIHLKTDSQFLHGFTLGVIAGERHVLEDSTHDLYGSSVLRDHMEIKTHYEKIYLDEGLPITYLRFQLK